jgi:DNA-binding CsgD family transcriptional regulator
MMNTSFEALTAAERRLLEWLSSGRTNAQIGAGLNRSEKTIRNQLTQLYAKLQVANRTEAVAVYLRGLQAPQRPHVERQT